MKRLLGFLLLLGSVELLASMEGYEPNRVDRMRERFMGSVLRRSNEDMAAYKMLELLGFNNSELFDSSHPKHLAAHNTYVALAYRPRLQSVLKSMLGQ